MQSQVLPSEHLQCSLDSPPGAMRESRGGVMIGMTQVKEETLRTLSGNKMEKKEEEV